MNWKPELDELARREAFARQMGGADKVKRQREQGRLTVRERIDGLLDQGSFHEIGAVSGTAEYDDKGALKNVTPANCVFGRTFRKQGFARTMLPAFLPLWKHF